MTQTAAIVPTNNESKSKARLCSDLSMKAPMNGLQIIADTSLVNQTVPAAPGVQPLSTTRKTEVTEGKIEKKNANAIMRRRTMVTSF